MQNLVILDKSAQLAPILPPDYYLLSIRIVMMERILIVEETCANDSAVNTMAHGDEEVTFHGMGTCRVWHGGGPNLTSSNTSNSA